jgi:S1-C subfamily serine protease
MDFSNAVADAVEQAAKVTVLVNARRRYPLSGVLIGADQVLTASHGVEREEDIQVGLADGRDVAATLLGRDRGTDLAVLRLSEPAGGAAAQPAAAPARVGHIVVAIGRPMPGGVQASLGMITGLGRAVRTQNGGRLDQVLVTDAVPYPGFSGGPLIDLAGGILGLNTSGLVHGSSLAIPAADAWRAAQMLAEHGHLRRGFLGIRSQVVEIPPAVRQELSAAGSGQTTGLLVVGAEAEGAAAAAGLMVGDILVGLNGEPVASHDDLLVRLSGEVVGKTVPVQVLRGGSLKTLQITIGEAP